MGKRWIVWVSVVLVLLLAIGLAAMVYTGSSPVAKTVRWTGVADPLPPEQAFQKARERAAAWALDAVLVRVETSWRPDGYPLELRVLPVTWSFTFYSPSEDAIATVAVNAEKVFWIPAMEVAHPPQSLPAFPPPYGVDRMWLTFLGAGGKEFIHQHPDASVHISLQMGDDEVPVWQISAIGEGGHWSIRLDAETGIVLP